MHTKALRSKIVDHYFLKFPEIVIIDADHPLYGAENDARCERGNRAGVRLQGTTSCPPCQSMPSDSLESPPRICMLMLEMSWIKDRGRVQ